jgi:hypothetical protein
MVTSNACDEPTGALGKIMQAQGAGTANNFSTATYPSTATGTGKILRADGTNWVATTATFPNTAGTSGNILTSDGTNWSSTAPSSTLSLLNVSGVLTNAQIKALKATPITIISAPGSGKVIVPICATMTMNYGGTNAFANTGTEVHLFYSTVQNITTLFASAVFSATSSQYKYTQISSLDAITLSTISNVAMTLNNNTGAEITGNAANDNTMSYQVFYYIMTP